MHNFKPRLRQEEGGGGQRLQSHRRTCVTREIWHNSASSRQSCQAHITYFILICLTKAKVPTRHRHLPLSLSRIGIFIIITIASFALFNLAHVQPPSKSRSDSQFGAWQGNHNAGTKQYANNFYRYMTEIHKMPNAEERARQTHVFMVTCV